MNTYNAFEEVLASTRVNAPEIRDFFTQDFTEVITDFAKARRRKHARTRGTEAVALYTRELKRPQHSDVMKLARRSLAAALLESSMFRFHGSAPSKHHWTPMCYLSKFVGDVEQSRSRTVRIPGLDYSSGEPKAITLLDSEFAHKPVKGVGFYELAAERFFSIIESRYSNALLRINDDEPKTTDFYLANFVIMLAMQTLRSPHPGEKKFHLNTLVDFAKALATLLDRIESGYAYIHKSEKALPFIPYAPTRARVAVNQAYSWYFPLSPTLAFVLSEEKLSKEELARNVEGSRVSTIKWARRNKSQLFGVTETQL